MVDSSSNNVVPIQAYEPPPQYPSQQPPGYPPQYPPQPYYGGPGMPPPTQPPGGYYPQPDIGDTLSDALNLYKTNFSAFFSFWAIPAILAIILSLIPIFVLGGGLNKLGVTPDSEPDIGVILSLLSFSLMLLIAIAIINMLFTGGIIGMTKKAMDTGKTDSGTGFETIKKYFAAIIATSIVVGILIAIGFILCCIPGILFCYWWMFAVTIVVVEGVGLSEAMSRSKQFAETRHTFWFAVVLFVIIIIINIIASVITEVIASGLIFAIGFWPGWIVSTVIGQLFQWIIAPFATIAIAIHYIKGRAPPVMPPPIQYPQTQYQQTQYPPYQYGPPPQNMP